MVAAPGVGYIAESSNIGVTLKHPPPRRWGPLPCTFDFLKIQGRGPSTPPCTFDLTTAAAVRAAVAAAVRLAPPHRPDAWRRRRPATKLDRDATLLGGFDRYRLAHLHLCARWLRRPLSCLIETSTCSHHPHSKTRKRIEFFVGAPMTPLMHIALPVTSTAPLPAPPPCTLDSKFCPIYLRGGGRFNVTPT